jgi:hypothetical protein
MPRIAGLALAVLVAAAGSVRAQSATDRFAIESAIGIDVFRGGAAADRPQIIVDVLGTVRLGAGWEIYVRPWIRQPRAPQWDVQLYAAAVRYERPGRIALRIDTGYIASPIGLGLLDASPAVNALIGPHITYFAPMLPFDDGGPRMAAIASSYPLGSVVALSTSRWDARAAVVNSPPTRIYVVGGSTNPKQTPVLEAAGGFSPTAGMRIGGSFARGQYLSPEERTRAVSVDRMLTLVGVEGEYAFGHTKLAGELVRDWFSGSLRPATALAWFVQGSHTLSPRLFVAARHDGTSAPVRGSGIVFAGSPYLRTLETAVGLRLTPDLTLRSSLYQRQSYGRTVWDRQVGFSLVWARRWW